MLRVYVLVDTSGSTVRGGFLDACNMAMPDIVGLLERHATPVLFSLLAYGTSAAVMVRMTDVADLRMIPPLRAGGLSSLTSGLRLLARCLDEDAAQLAADGIAGRGAVAVVLADGLPTDRDSDVLTARAALTDSHFALHVAMRDTREGLATAGLRARFHGLGGEIGPAIVAAVAAALSSDDGDRAA